MTLFMIRSRTRPSTKSRAHLWQQMTVRYDKDSEADTDTDTLHSGVAYTARASIEVQNGGSLASDMRPVLYVARCCGVRSLHSSEIQNGCCAYQGALKSASEIYRSDCYAVQEAGCIWLRVSKIKSVSDLSVRLQYPKGSLALLLQCRRHSMSSIELSSRM